MKFSKLRHRIIFLKPAETEKNTMHETVPVWIPVKPTDEAYSAPEAVNVTCDYKGNAIINSEGGQLYSHSTALNGYAVWAAVAPMTGHEYDEAQKLRAETTYKVTTRYFPNITTDMKILHGLKVLDIVSILNIDERNAELQIVAKERDRYGESEG